MKVLALSPVYLGNIWDLTYLEKCKKILKNTKAAGTLKRWEPGDMCPNLFKGCRNEKDVLQSQYGWLYINDKE